MASAVGIPLKNWNCLPFPSRARADRRDDPAQQVQVAEAVLEPDHVRQPREFRRGFGVEHRVAALVDDQRKFGRLGDGLV